MKKIGIIGATGYAGVELLRLLLSRQDLEVAAISSVSFEGKPISQVYPNLYQICDSKLTGEDTVIEKSDLIFRFSSSRFVREACGKVRRKRKASY